jgi:hypothetical protein
MWAMPTLCVLFFFSLFYFGHLNNMASLGISEARRNFRRDFKPDRVTLRCFFVQWTYSERYDDLDTLMDRLVAGAQEKIAEALKVSRAVVFDWVGTCEARAGEGAETDFKVVVTMLARRRDDKSRNFLQFREKFSLEKLGLQFDFVEVPKSQTIEYCALQWTNAMKASVRSARSCRVFEHGMSLHGAQSSRSLKRKSMERDVDNIEDTQSVSVDGDSRTFSDISVDTRELKPKKPRKILQMELERDKAAAEVARRELRVKEAELNLALEEEAEVSLVDCSP